MVISVIAIFLSIFTPITSLYEGESCIVPKINQEGKCIDIFECEYAKQLLLQAQHQTSPNYPPTCGFNRQGALVCCPVLREEIKAPPSGSRSVEKCKEYHDVKREVFAVAGGFKALPKEFPHMAAVGFGNRPNILWLCGGTLISDRFVLTAAHCTRSREFGAAKWIRLGDLDLKNTTEDADPIDLSVVQIFEHPGYQPPLHYNDIALLETKTVFFGLYYKPACLHVDFEIPNKLEATGWGKTDYLADVSSHMLKVDLDVIDFNKCASAYSNTSPRKLPNGIINETQICAGDLAGTGKDTCPGDSGGPLHFKIARTENLVEHFEVVGVTSFGKGCGIDNTVGVYTRVSSYIDWIENIVWPVES